jgi:hypothetical protein
MTELSGIAVIIQKNLYNVLPPNVSLLPGTMRDQLKDEDYFKEFIRSQNQSIDKFRNWIETGVTPAERIPIVKCSLAEKTIAILIAEYSMGEPIEQLKKCWLRSVELISENWAGAWKLDDGDGTEYDQYILSAYDEMLWMLSLGYLLDVPEEDFKKLVTVIDHDQVKDCLLEFIIRAKIKDRPVLTEESYRKYFNIPEIFDKIRRATTEENNMKAEILIGDFVTEDWYKNHKGAAWFDNHRSKSNTYFGYWSFESAAVVKIRGLDDSTFRDGNHYPKDLL